MPSLLIQPTLHYLDVDPAVATFVATALPRDPERDQLVSDYRRQVAAFDRASARRKTIARQIEETVDALADSDAGDWDTLLDRYQRLTTELMILPTVRRKIAYRMAWSLEAWLRITHVQLREEIRRRNDELGRVWADQASTRELATRIAKRTNFTAVEELNRAYVAPENLEIFDDAVAELKQAESLKAQLEEARRIAQLIDGITRQHFGNTSAGIPGAHSIDLFVDRVAGPARAAAA